MLTKKEQEEKRHYDGGDIRGGKRVEPANKYRCVHCGKVVEREMAKKWIPSYCEETDRNVRLQLVTK